ncbi:Transcription factor LHW-like protein [Drosera capensis]
MGEVLKEALRSLCGFRRWEYAVFWKFGPQNPRLLIWEAFHIEPLPHSVLAGNPDTESSKRTLEALEEYTVAVKADDGKRVVLLVNKMMAVNRVHVLGEGMVGRAAFSGNHQWIVAEDYIANVQSAEVQNEVELQFSAGMQTVAVIPIPSHGVVQLGSSLPIPEDLSFVQEVKSMILRLSSVLGAPLLDSCISTKNSKDMEQTAPYARSVSVDHHWTPGNMTSVSPIPNSSFIQGSLLQDNSLGCRIQDVALTTSTAVELCNLTRCSSKSCGDQCQPKIFGQLDSSEIVHMNQDVLLSHQSFSLNPSIGYHQNQSGGTQRHSELMGNQVGFGTDALQVDALRCFITSQLNAKPSGHMAHGGKLLTASCSSSDDFQGYIGKQSCSTKDSFIEMAGSQCRGSEFFVGKIAGLTDWMGHSNHILSDGFDNGSHCVVEKQDSCYDMRKGDQDNLYDAVNMASINAEECSSSSPSALGMPELHNGSQVTAHRDLFEDVHAQSSSGDNLFDVLGIGFKKRVLEVNRSCKGRGPVSENLIKDVPRSLTWQVPGPDFYSNCEKDPKSRHSFESDSDNLLEAIVSGVKCSMRQPPDNNESSISTLTKVGSSSLPSVIVGGGGNSMRSVMQEERVLPSKHSYRLGESGASVIAPTCGKIEAGNYSHTSSLYGSDISFWMEQGSQLRQDTSIASAASKNVDAGKMTRKRLKPGENPRPRPKDRQMIQDRMKELREIVPNGAKCSIDALLERTIKHMLFLQSVTKHANKLKQMVESKMINEDGGLFLKNNYEGGATWAFEVGTQSMLCPIIVEDLNPPRELLIEMLCEEGGFFLEMADIIRGLGLTILRGVLETHDGKIWARFAVEANRDVTRMEIFIPLVHMLERIVKSNGPSFNGETEDIKAAQQTGHCTVPTTAIFGNGVRNGDGSIIDRFGGKQINIQFWQASKRMLLGS